MGSYCEIRFDDLHVLSAKSAVPDIYVSLFQESDLRCPKNPKSANDEEIEEEHVYAVRRAVMLQRFDILGITADAARRAFEDWHRGEIEVMAEWANDGESWARDELKALRRLSFEAWSARVPQALRDQFDSKKKRSGDAIEEKMLDRDDGWLFFKASDIRLTVRALLDACHDIKEVTLDISDLVGGGYINQNTSICDEARRPSAMTRPVLEPTIILGEGSSDVRVLKLSLGVLHPHLKDFFSFFDHKELSVDGGASYLVKFLQAFAAARISSRIVALFDNDTAGGEAYNRAKALPLPSNIKVLRLPDIELAKSYPSVGAQGTHFVDVNGRAASIELYLGRQNLTRSDGELTPVRWGGRSDKAGAYQGEIEGKADVVNRFCEGLRRLRTTGEAQAALPELVEIWQLIFETMKTYG
jgi:hypothetical protein